METSLTGCPLPETILLASGGIRGASYLGALEELERAGGLARVRCWAGVSAGALTATILALGYSIREIHEFTMRFDWSLLKNIDETSPLRLFDFYGLDTGERMARFIAALFHVRGLADTLTFAELPGTKELKIWATNINTSQLVCYSRATTPDVSIAFALQASMCIPVVFDPLRNDDGHLIADGAILNAFPMNTLTVEERARTLGLIVYVPPANQPIDSFIEYLKHTIYMAFEYRSNTSIELFQDQLITIDTTGIDGINFGISVDEKKALLDRGAAAMRAFLERWRLRQRLQGVKRRNSI
jgi:NTE family protein